MHTTEGTATTASQQAFAAVPAPGRAPHPYKHVRYNLGMVLGVDDFTQEFAYLSHRDRWLARDLLGYGTVNGLRVTHETGEDKKPRVRVDPGVAVTRGGQLVRVPTAQCAYLNDWLAANAPKVEALLRSESPQSPPSPLSPSPLSPPLGPGIIPLYVVLCYRACKTDNVPIPGEPCRCEEETSAASRWADDFELQLRTAAPDLAEEKALRRFVGWLKAVDVSPAAASPAPAGEADREAFLQAIRDASRSFVQPASPPTSPPASPPASPVDSLATSPPAGLTIPADQACDYLRAAFRLWVTEIRPRVHAYPPACPTGCGCGCGGHEPASAPTSDDDCVLLARVEVPVEQEISPPADARWRVSDPDGIAVSDEMRPYVAHVRMLQEWMLCGRCACEAGTPASPPEGPPLSPPSSPTGPVVLPNLAGDVTGAITTNTISRLLGQPVSGVPTAGAGEVLQTGAGGWMPRTLSLAGEVTGSLNGTQVTQLLGQPLSGAPVAGQMLRFNAGAWTPAPLNANGDVIGPEQALSIRALQTQILDVSVAAAGVGDGATVLTRNGANEWVPGRLTLPEAPPPQPVTGTFVTRGARPAYTIVAAGVVSTIRTPDLDMAPVYNDLRVVRDEPDPGDGLIRLRFTGYTPPGDDDRFQYIIKVLVWPMTQSLGTPAVVFERYERRSFLLRVLNSNGNVGSVMERLRLMVEVSRFERSAEVPPPLGSPVIPGPDVPGPVVPGPVVPGPVVPDPVVPGPRVPGPVIRDPIIRDPVIPGPVVPGPVIRGPGVLDPIGPRVVGPDSAVGPGGQTPDRRDRVTPGPAVPGAPVPDRNTDTSRGGPASTRPAGGERRDEPGPDRTGRRGKRRKRN